jgi:2-dehydropantoate 2-reductase
VTGRAAKIAVVGPGAIGATFASVVQQAGHDDVVLCGRTALDHITVESDSREPVVLRSPVRTDPATVPAPVDWLLLAVKAHQTDGAAEWLTALAGPDTVVVVLQNGVEHRTRVEPHVGAATVLSTVIWCPAEAITKDRIRLRGRPSLTVPDSPAGRALADLLAPGGAKVDPVGDFQTAQWHKLAVNAVAGLEVLAGRRAGMYRRDDIRALARSFAAECLAVARADGADLPEPMADEITDRFVAMPPDLGTSILYDRQAGLPLEWDARNGVVQRLGAKYGIATPISDIVVPLLAAASDDAN